MTESPPQGACEACDDGPGNRRDPERADVLCARVEPERCGRVASSLSAGAAGAPARVSGIRPAQAGRNLLGTSSVSEEAEAPGRCVLGDWEAILIQALAVRSYRGGNPEAQ